MGTYTMARGSAVFRFGSLKELMAKASPLRSGDCLAGLAARSQAERVAAQMRLADVPLKDFLREAIVPYETDEVTRLIMDSHDEESFAPLASLTVGELREWLLRYETRADDLRAGSRGLTPEMVAAVSKLCRNQDLILIASKCRVVTAFRNTIGLPGRMSVRLQPNHPTDDPAGIGAEILDGLLLGAGDAVIGINPAADNVAAVSALLRALDQLINEFAIPTQSCVLAHITTQLKSLEGGAPADLLFQSIAGTEAANRSFGINLNLLREAHDAARSLGRGTKGSNVMYFETGQGSCLSAEAHHGVDQCTLEARAYAVARAFDPLLVNTVVGFIGPEYLYDGKQITRAGLEDHFCGKLLGVPMGCDICYTNHAEADQEDMDNLLTLLATAGCTYIMGVPGHDDVMLNYQSTSFHDAHYIRQLLGLRPSPEFEDWLGKMSIANPSNGQLQIVPETHRLVAHTQRLAESWHPSDGQGRHRRSDQATLGTSHAGSHKTIAAADQKPAPLSADPWAHFRTLTPARIGLGRAGASLPTAVQLKLRADRAHASDAVAEEINLQALAEQCAPRRSLVLQSDCNSKAEYLLRPDKGRVLSAGSVLDLDAAVATADATGRTFHKHIDVVLIVADGLSARAVSQNAPPLVNALAARIQDAGLILGPIVLVRYGRVAIQDEIGQRLRARLSMILLGERPGLGQCESLGAYVTYAPQKGKSDAMRNCISNIHASGLDTDQAASRSLSLILAALRFGYTGVHLKEHGTCFVMQDNHISHDDHRQSLV